MSPELLTGRPDWCVEPSPALLSDVRHVLRTNMVSHVVIFLNAKDAHDVLVIPAIKKDRGKIREVVDNAIIHLESPIPPLPVNMTGSGERSASDQKCPCTE